MLDQNIKQFIQSHKVATLCCVDEQNNPHCFNCFYAFDSSGCLLFFKSSATSLHSKLLQEKRALAGTILPDKLTVIPLKGIQLSGTLLNESHDLAQQAWELYHKKFPFALAIPGDVFTVKVDAIKMTGNGKVFGKKIEWQRENTVRLPE